MGGGLPIGAFGGKKHIMELLAPSGPVYQAGTLSGNPVSVAAGLTTLDLLSEPDVYPQLELKTNYLVEGLKVAAKEFNIPLVINSACGLFGIFFTEQETVTSFEEVLSCDSERFKQFFHLMLNNGIYLAPSAYESGFVSAAHKQQDLDQTLRVSSKAFASLSKLAIDG
jgi:glutamate-1-semialdehyde 2,1-aminomutase